MLKRLLFFLFLTVLAVSVLAVPALAQEQKTLYLFWSKSCPHCAKEKIFLEKMEDKYPQLEVKDFEISGSQENRDLFKKVGEKFGSPGYVPFTVVGEDHFVGFLDEATTGEEIEEAIVCHLADGCQDVVAPLLGEGAIIQPEPSRPKGIPESVSLPIIGELKTRDLSLPVLTLVIALLDGFNPCAMWTLLFLISLLLGMQDRKRMWILGVSFIAASGAVYFLFLSAWLNLFLFLGLVLWVRIIVGVFALAAGGYHLRDFWKNKEGGCATADDKKRQKTFEKLKKITQDKNIWLALGGIVLLAVAVNMVELVCSAGLPAVYTQILSLSDLPRWQYYLYLLLYMLVFMADDLLVFVVAMTTLKAVGIESKYARWSRLIGGILMVLIGVLLLVKPEWLTFG